MIVNLISFFLGAFVGLFLYAIILVGKKAEDNFYKKGG